MITSVGKGLRVRAVSRNSTEDFLDEAAVFFFRLGTR